LYLDYKQAELVMMANYSQDPFLLDVYRSGKDLHDETSKEIFGSNFTSRDRFFAKAINFGLLYGRSAAGIANDTNLPGITKGQAIEFIAKYFKRMPKVVAFIEGIKMQVRAQGYVETPVGRRRRFPLRTEYNIAEIEREAINFMCQSAASDCTLMSLVRIHKQLAGRAHIVLTVHDSILLECPIGTEQEVATEASGIMSSTGAELFGDAAPLRVEAETGMHWGSLHAMKEA